MTTDYKRMRQLTGVASAWAANDLVIGSGEVAFEQEPDGTVQLKVGDGTRRFSQLPVFPSFILPGNGAIRRPVQDQALEWVSVQGFDADPTGVTGATAEIQNALNSGARVIRAKGTYLINSSLVLPVGVIFDLTDATLKAGADNVTLITSVSFSYSSQVIGGVFDGNGFSGVAAMDLSNFRLPSAIVRPVCQNMAVGIILRTGCFGLRIQDLVTMNCPTPLLVLANASTLAIDTPNLDNTPTFNGSGTGIGIDIRAGGGDNVGVVVRGGYVQGFTTGIKDAGLKTIVDGTYFELCSAADIEGSGAKGSEYRAIQHFANVGACGYKLRNCDACTVFDPLMPSGGRTALYDVDASNTNCYEYRPPIGGSMNVPTGALTYLGTLARQNTGTYLPVVVGSGTAGAAANYSVQVGKWSRTGNTVHFELTVTWSGHTGTGNITITGLPAGLAPAAYLPGRVFNVLPNGMAFTGPVVCASFTGSSTALNLLQTSAAGVLSLVPLTAAGTLHVSGSYEL